MGNTVVVSKVSGPYARALLDLAKSKKNLSKITCDISDLIIVFSAIPELTNYLKNPLIYSSDKKYLMKEIMDGMMHSDTINFIQFLIDYRRIEYFTAIAEKFLALVWKHIGLQVVTYQSAVPLTNDQELELSQNLKKLIGGKHIQLIRELDKSIIGGLVIKFDSKVIDLSLRGELRKIANVLGTNLNFEVSFN